MKRYIFLIVLVLALAAFAMPANVSGTQDSQTPPDFPACRSYTEPGDWQHYDSGEHQIVGGGIVEGTDDVYTFGENFVQCFCSPDGDGIQTSWWRTDQVLEGWFSENGLQWNLGDYHYLAQNSEYDCSEPEPTPTPTPGNACPDPSPTQAPTVSGFRSSPTSIVLTWNSVEPVSHYMIQYGKNSGSYEYSVLDIGNTNIYEVKDLEPNVQYFFQVAGVNGCQPGDWSNEVSPREKVLGAAVHEPVDAGLEGIDFISIAQVLGIAGPILYLSSRYTKKNYLLDR